MSSNTSNPIKVGVWCAYHVTLEACEGIGVFAHNVAMGMAGQEGCAGVDMVCKPGDEHILASTVKKGGGKIRAVPLPGILEQEKTPTPTPSKLKRYLEKRRFKAERRLERARSTTWDTIRHNISRRYMNNAQGNQSSNPTARRFFVNLATAVSWAGFELTKPCYKLLIKVQSSLISLLSREVEEHRLSPAEQEQQIIDACDVWLIPYVLLDRQFTKPTVVTIHDLVCVHFPQMMSPEALKNVVRLATKIGEQSTVAACMSNFIKKTDLIGVLDLPLEKIRVVEPDAPSDFGKPARKSKFIDTHPVLDQAFIFYPAGFRPYKNHEALIEALAILANQGNEELHLVFTGIQAPSPELLERIQQNGLQSRVHILGKVSRDVLSLFYQNATATVIPSLYEQGSYPLMEAMYWGCPIACSNIESLIERFHVLGDAMEFFDPHNYQEIAETMNRLLHGNSAIREAQQKQRDKIFGRTAAAAGADWLDVMHYAIERDNKSAPATLPRAA